MKEKQECNNCKHKQKLGYESPCSECCLSVGKGEFIKLQKRNRNLVL